MAAAKSLLLILGALGFVQALSLTQRKTEEELVRAVEPPSIEDVKDQLGAVNDTLDKITDTVDSINSTAYGMLETFLDSTSSFTSALGALQKAAAAAAMLPGGDSISEAATKFIGLANSSLEKATGQLPAIVSKVESQLDTIIPEIQKIAYSLMDEFLDAANDILALSNATDTSLLKKVKKAKQTEKVSKKLKHGKKAQHVEKTSKKVVDHKGKHAKKAVSLLEERALRSEGMSSSSVSVDQSVSRKGSSNPCSTALAEVTKANTTLTTMVAKVQAVNGTAFDLLGQILDVASSSLDTINSTLAPALDAASAIPSSILSPVTEGIDTLLSVGDTLTSTVQDNLATVQDMIADAQDTLSTVYELSDTLVAAVSEAQCAGACGDAMKAQCDGS